MIRCDQGRPSPPESLGYRHKEIKLKELQDTLCILYFLKHKIKKIILTDLYIPHVLYLQCVFL